MSKNATFKLLTSDNIEFSLNFFEPDLEMINMIVPFLYGYIEDYTEYENWQVIISKYDDNDLDLLRMKKPIILSGINSRVLKYLLGMIKNVGNL